jgi:hypothetical protein
VAARMEREQAPGQRGPGGLESFAGAAGGAFAGLAAYQWLSEASSAHEAADGSGWLEAPDGGLWFMIPPARSSHLTETLSLPWAPTGSSTGLPAMELSSLGSRMGRLSPGSDGHLDAFDQAGNDMVLGDDGGFYLQGADGGFYTLGVDGAFYGVDSDGQYFAAPDGSGFTSDELAAAGVGGGEGMTTEAGWRTCSVELASRSRPAVSVLVR